MYIVGHRIGLWTSKVILTVICLSLLTAQSRDRYRRHPVTDWSPMAAQPVLFRTAFGSSQLPKEL